MPVHWDPFWQVTSLGVVPHLKRAVAPASGWHVAADGKGVFGTVQGVPNVPAQFATCAAALAAVAAYAPPWAPCPTQAGAQVLVLSHVSAKLAVAVAVIPWVAE